MTSYLFAISCAHELAGLNDPTETAIICQILKGYRRLAPIRDVRLPITLPILRQLVAFFSFLRIGEITVNESDQSNLIRLN